MLIHQNRNVSHLPCFPGNDQLFLRISKMTYQIRSPPIQAEYHTPHRDGTGKNCLIEESRPVISGSPDNAEQGKVMLAGRMGKC